jgi:PhnB protein
MSVKPIPDGYHTVTPYITVSDGAAALEFYEKALGATVVMRFDTPDGRVAHAEIQIGDSKVMLGGECPVMGNKSPLSLGGTTGGLCVYVEDCDALFDRAVAAGATVMKPVTDQFYGDRSGTVIDPFGHAWTIATHKEDVSIPEMKRRMAALMQPQAA